LQLSLKEATMRVGPLRLSEAVVRYVVGGDMRVKKVSI
jgi:hypothetical protein